MCIGIELMRRKKFPVMIDVIYVLLIEYNMKTVPTSRLVKVTLQFHLVVRIHDIGAGFGTWEEALA